MKWAIISLSSITKRWNSSYRALIILISFWGIQYFFMITHRLSLCPSVCVDVHGSIPLASLLQDVPGEKDPTDSPCPDPCLFFPKGVANPTCILLMRILLSTLLTSGSKLTPLRLLHYCKLPFFEIWHINPFFHPFGTFSFFHTWSKLCFNFFFAGLVNICWSIFAVIWSAPEAFPSWVGDSGVFLLSTSSKCSLHIARLASLFCSSSQFLLFTAAVCRLRLPDSCVEVLYSSFYLPFSVSFCTLSAFSAIHLLLSSLTLKFYWQWSSINLVSTLSELVLSIFDMIGYFLFIYQLSGVFADPRLVFFTFLGPNTSPADFTYAIFCCSHLSLILVSAVSSLCSSSFFHAVIKLYT